MGHPPEGSNAGFFFPLFDRVLDTLFSVTISRGAVVDVEAVMEIET